MCLCTDPGECIKSNIIIALPVKIKIYLLARLCWESSGDFYASKGFLVTDILVGMQRGSRLINIQKFPIQLTTMDPLAIAAMQFFKES